MGSSPSASVLTFDLLVVSGLTVLLTAGSPLALWQTDEKEPLFTEMGAVRVRNPSVDSPQT